MDSLLIILETKLYDWYIDTYNIKQEVSESEKDFCETFNYTTYIRWLIGFDDFTNIGTCIAYHSGSNNVIIPNYDFIVALVEIITEKTIYFFMVIINKELVYIISSRKVLTMSRREYETCMQDIIKQKINKIMAIFTMNEQEIETAYVCIKNKILNIDSMHTRLKSILELYLTK